jgi:hypothetical protein
MRAVVFGGRDYQDRVRLFYELDRIGELFDISCVISGMAAGADSLAISWASKWDLQVVLFPADWKKHGGSAGAIRNQQMIDEGKPDLAVAFPGGNGTADMLRRCKKASIRTIIIEK